VLKDIWSAGTEVVGFEDTHRGLFVPGSEFRVLEVLKEDVSAGTKVGLLPKKQVNHNN
jgi:hypothetical protein